MRRWEDEEWDEGEEWVSELIGVMISGTRVTERSCK